MTADWADLDATAQADLVRIGEASPLDLVDAAIARIESVDPGLGVVPIRCFERARDAAQRVDRRADFAGVTFLMKDVGARQVGHPYYAGNRALRAVDHRAARDTPLGARFREVGLVTLGSSNAPEFGLQSNTWPLVHGPTRNPWNPSHSAGGSSGGACAAVAAGLVPVAHASDGAGSIRIPASWCGLVGLKPTRDRIVWRHAGHGRPDVEFVVARSLRDTAAFLDLLRPRRARRDAPRPFRDCLDAPLPSGLRVGFTTRSPAGVPVHPRARGAVERAANLLDQSGCAVEETAPRALFDVEERSLHGAVVGPLEYQDCLDELADRLGRAVDANDVEPFLWELAHGESLAADAGAIARAQAFSTNWTQRMLAWFTDFDLLLTPTVHEPAPALSALDPTRSAPIELLERMVLHMSFTEPWNATGQPALSLPFGTTDAGLPIGLQLVAAPGREDLLLRMSAHLLGGEDALRCRPALHA